MLGHGALLALYGLLLAASPHTIGLLVAVALLGTYCAATDGVMVALASGMLPAAARVETRPGTTPSVRPRSCAKSAVISVPDASPASMTTVIRARAAIRRLRAGKLQR